MLVGGVQDKKLAPIETSHFPWLLLLLTFTGRACWSASIGAAGPLPPTKSMTPFPSLVHHLDHVMPASQSLTTRVSFQDFRYRRTGPVNCAANSRILPGSRGQPGRGQQEGGGTCSVLAGVSYLPPPSRPTTMRPTIEPKVDQRPLICATHRVMCVHTLLHTHTHTHTRTLAHVGACSHTRIHRCRSQFARQAINAAAELTAVLRLRHRLGPGFDSPADVLVSERHGNDGAGLLEFLLDAMMRGWARRWGLLSGRRGRGDWERGRVPGDTPPSRRASSGAGDDCAASDVTPGSGGYKPTAITQASIVLLLRGLITNVSLRVMAKFVCQRYSILREPGSIPDRVTPGFSHVGIVTDDAAGRPFTSGISRIHRPCIPALLHSRISSLCQRCGRSKSCPREDTPAVLQRDGEVSVRAGRPVRDPEDNWTAELGDNEGAVCTLRVLCGGPHSAPPPPRHASTKPVALHTCSLHLPPPPPSCCATTTAPLSPCRQIESLSHHREVDVRGVIVVLREARHTAQGPPARRGVPRETCAYVPASKIQIDLIKAMM
ncbi:hypothetical protein PR048_024903 [Dryococelus australis]|uniref:Uncharacterized protein n=1 Tax=Dryococelus australis TaxID=614101 RepID=A0ABQ9GPX4_9NEOP|nr:hypothetical protein PR048_024903 [Dryococelus australis]